MSQLVLTASVGKTAISWSLLVSPSFLLSSFVGRDCSIEIMCAITTMTQTSCPFGSTLRGQKCVFQLKGFLRERETCVCERGFVWRKVKEKENK